MKKKLVFLSLTSIASLAIVASAVAIGAKANKTIERTLGTEYQLVISDPLYTGEGTQTVAEQKVLKTALGNDVKIEYNGFSAYQPGYEPEYDEGINCWEGEVAGYIEVIPNSESHGIAGISSVELQVDNDTYGNPALVIGMGWEAGNFVSAEKQETDDSTHIMTYYLNNTQPTFIRIAASSDDSSNRFGLHKITITYTCVETECPLVVDGDFVLTQTGGTYTVSEYNGTDTIIEIPASYNGIPVTAIANNFQTNNINKNQIEAVVLPDSVTYIGDYAFAYASKLELINLDNVEHIGEDAFSYNYALEEINLKKATYIDYEAFYYCTALKKIGGFDSIEYISDNAFELCPLTGEDLLFPATLSYIGGGAFLDTHIRGVLIDDGAEASIEDGAFRSTWLEEIYIGENTMFYDDLLFNDNLATIEVSEDNLYYKAIDNVLYEVNGENDWDLVRIAQNRPETVYVMPDQVHYINPYCAYDCQTLRSLTINNVITTIFDYTFNWCENLETLTIGTNVSLIEHSFYGCESLKSVYFPASVKTINQQAFGDCTALESIEFAPEGCEYIAGQAFKDCTSLVSVLLPSTLNNLGANESWPDENDPDIFSGCTSLTQVLTYLEPGHEYTGTIVDGWLGGRELVYYN